jgi:hypothetical protein
MIVLARQRTVYVCGVANLGEEDHVVREDDNLPLPCLLDKTRCDPFFTVMVKRCDWIIKDDTDIVLIESDLGQKVGEGDSSLLAFAQDFLGRPIADEQ